MGYSPILVKESVRFQLEVEPLFYNYIFKILLILSDIHKFENKYRDSNEIYSLYWGLLIESDEIIKKSYSVIFL